MYVYILFTYYTTKHTVNDTNKMVNNKMKK